MPGPKPVSCPVFPDGFLQQARLTVRCRTASYQSVQRYRLALLLHENKYLAHEEAGRRVGLSGRQVRRWRERWAAGDFSVEDVPGGGRKSDFSPSGSCFGQSGSM